MQRLLIFFSLLLASNYISQARAQDDFVFPGPTDRPSRFPLHTTAKPARDPATAGPITSPPVTNAPPVTTVSPVQASTPNINDYNECINRCVTTSEYNPVCGSDNVVYSNPGRLNCAVNCGNPITSLHYGQCDQSSVRG